MTGVNDNMSSSATLIANLRASEGLQNGGRHYTDAAHNCTRGVGILVHPGDCTPAELTIPLDAADNKAELIRRIHVAEQDVRNQVGDRVLTQDQFDALVSAAFNMGGGGVAPVLSAANRNDNPGVVDALRARVNAAERDRHGNRTGRMIRLPGLVTRREQEARPFLPLAGR